MQYRRLPNGELEVSVVGLGCWAFGGEHWGDDVDDRSSREAIHAALDLGVTLFDTAPLYGDGHADRVLRDALGPRIHEVVIATKAGARMHGDHPASDLSAESLRRDVEASLARLGVEALDLVQAHWPDERGTPLEETLEAFERLVSEGKIRFFGLCNYGPAELERAARLAPVATLETPLSLIRREYEAELAPVAMRAGVGVLAYEPLARGLLTAKHRALPRFPESDMRRRDPRFWAARFGRVSPALELLRQAAARLDTSPAAIAIAWAARRPGVTSVLAGAKRASQVRENAAASELLRNEAPWPLLERVAARFG